MSTNYKCVCGKVCSSQPGLTLHQKSCEKVQEAKEAGQATASTEDESGEPIQHHEEIQRQEMSHLLDHLRISNAAQLLCDRLTRMQAGRIALQARNPENKTNPGPVLER